MRPRLVIAAVSALLIASAGASEATPITYTFTGTVSFDYDPDAALQSSGPFFPVGMRATFAPTIGSFSVPVFNGFVTVTPAAAVPEPASLLLLGIGLLAAGARRWWKPRRAQR